MAEKEISSRVRFAPSPTGKLHIGGIRTALFDYFQARSTDGEFVLRIEDTDQARKVEGAEDLIKDSLIWLGADWDEYAVQSERLGEYKKYADKLVEKGAAVEEEGAIRFIVPERSEGISWTDAIGERRISIGREDVDNFIILKKDGFPTYHLANVVDDHEMRITHVIRGDEWISSTPKHILLYEALGWEPPIFAHVPNVLGVDGKKLSKRFGAKSALEYREEGYLPEALLNYLMLLGWSPSGDRTIVTKEEIIEEFSLDKVNVAPAIFNEKKLEWMNGEYIRGLALTDLEKRLRYYDNSSFEVNNELSVSLIPVAQSRMKKLGEFADLVGPFITGESIDENEIKNGFADALSQIDEWNNENIVKVLKKYVKDSGISFQDLYQGVIGKRQGLPLGDVFVTLGKEATLSFLGH